MRSQVLIVAAPGRYPRIEASGAIAVRHTASDTLHLVSAAATPLGGDHTRIRVVVEPGALLRIRSVAAAVTLPGRHSRDSHTRFDLEVAGDLNLDPEPTIVAADSRHFSDIRVRLADGARIALRERVQIGRTGERDGFFSGSLTADLDDGPLLRHRVELGAGSIADDALGSPRALISEFGYPDVAEAPLGMALTLAHGGVLSTWQGDRLPAQPSNPPLR
ncbi:urease accessory protein UreD [Mycolicibacterium brumae]|uniref:Urease accessory protein n=1 Tax=Mycolicibacterium brumae TaxID=85968 RepID=A0A2G5P559_9MYCO|nr:urease accessory protein UreD [Mycolicibacterium brumae]MCV7191697.1 urease accessory protein UreD [Mycolicibacterium brumae]PIB73509.1 urease accessory protein [Mycolicibacterium brumae]RWA20448.1 hypothetical protein MBRU_01990 [Mycolicibacterium brumae DSM 44177]UWW07548.1 urease accessory protein UreD [Mycolicibacterium brumae]